MSAAVPDPPPGRDHREALRKLLAERGFLHASEGLVLRTRSGSPMPWILYSTGVSLTGQGLTLMTAVILDRLREFRSTQLATFGVSAIPLVAACVATDDRYTGLVVRREAKPYGAMRRIDGPLDKNVPVVVVDDAIASGTAMRDAINALEAEGVTVEGAVAVVDFKAGVVEWLAAAGYRCATVFDVWRDLRPPPVGATTDSSNAPAGTERLPDGLSPAEVARQVVANYRSKGSIPRPPGQLDAEYDYAGGVFVSARRRSDNWRLVRIGVAESTAASAPSAAAAVVQAAHRAAESKELTELDDLTEVKFAVSLFGPGQPIEAGAIDHRIFALQVRSRSDMAQSGLALPNAPHYDDEVEQLRYASASLWRTVPRALFRHCVYRSVEPGMTWPTSGAPVPHEHWSDDSRLTEFFGHRVRQLLTDDPILSELPDVRSLVGDVSGVAVSLYYGRLIGCAVRFGSDVDTLVAEATAAALADRRYVDDVEEQPRAATHHDRVAAASAQAAGRRCRCAASLVLPARPGHVAGQHG